MNENLPKSIALATIVVRAKTAEAVGHVHAATCGGFMVGCDCGNPESPFHKPKSSIPFKERNIKFKTRAIDTAPNDVRDAKKLLNSARFDAYRLGSELLAQAGFTRTGNTSKKR